MKRDRKAIAQSAYYMARLRDRIAAATSAQDIADIIGEAPNGTCQLNAMDAASAAGYPCEYYANGVRVYPKA